MSNIDDGTSDGYGVDAMLASIDSFLAEIRYQSIVGVDTVTDRLLDLRGLITKNLSTDAFWAIVAEDGDLLP